MKLNVVIIWQKLQSNGTHSVLLVFFFFALGPVSVSITVPPTSLGPGLFVVITASSSVSLFLLCFQVALVVLQFVSSHLDRDCIICLGERCVALVLLLVMCFPLSSVLSGSSPVHDLWKAPQWNLKTVVIFWNLGWPASAWALNRWPAECCPFCLRSLSEN